MWLRISGTVAAVSVEDVSLTRAAGSRNYVRILLGGPFLLLLSFLLLFLCFHLGFPIYDLHSRAFSSVAACPHKPRLYIVTYLDRLSADACASLRSALTHGIELTVLGLNNDSGTNYGYILDAKRRKVPVMRDFLLQLCAEDVVVFVDGTDVMYNSRSKEALPTFLSLETPGMMLFGAERNCWPFMDGERELLPNGRNTCKNLSRQASSSFKYINAGTWAARAQTASTMLDTWFKALNAQQGDGDDQDALQSVMLSGQFTGGAIDSGCILFQTGWRTRLEQGGWNSSDDNGPFIDLNGVLQNTETKHSHFLRTLMAASHTSFLQ